MGTVGWLELISVRWPTKLSKMESYTTKSLKQAAHVTCMAEGDDGWMDNLEAQRVDERVCAEYGGGVNLSEPKHIAQGM